MWEILCSLEYERELRNDLVSEVFFKKFFFLLACLFKNTLC